MKAKQSLKAAELQDGDIVCFQRVTVDGKDSEFVSCRKALVAQTDIIYSSTHSSVQSSAPSGRASAAVSDHIDDAKIYYDFLRHRRVIKIYPHPTRGPDPGVEPFNMVLSSKYTYDQVATKVGEKLNADPTHLRFWTINVTTGNPKSAVKRAQNTQTLQSILTPQYSTFNNNSQRHDALFFEILDMSLSEMDTKKLYKITWLSDGITKEVGEAGSLTLPCADPM